MGIFFPAEANMGLFSGTGVIFLYLSYTAEMDARAPKCGVFNLIR